MYVDASRGASRLTAVWLVLRQLDPGDWPVENGPSDGHLFLGFQSREPLHMPLYLAYMGVWSTLALLGDQRRKHSDFNA